MERIARRLIITVMLNFGGATLVAQISPPGLGETNTASWLAIGIRQSLDTASKKQSVTYVGNGTISGFGTGNPFQKQAILVINEEFYNQFQQHWQYSVAVSYRRQNQYEEYPPYEPTADRMKQE